MTLKELEKAFNRALKILQNRPDGKDYLPIVQRLDQEIKIRRDDQDDYDRFRRMSR